MSVVRQHVKLHGGTGVGRHKHHLSLLIHNHPHKPHSIQMPKPPLSPAQWPFEQPGVLLAIKQLDHAIEQERLKTSTSIRDVSFQDFEDDEIDYSPSEGSVDEEDEELEDDSSRDSLEPMDLDIGKDELQDLARDMEENGWPSSPTPSGKERAKEKELEGQLEILDAAEKEAAAAYNPDEVVALLTEFYELLVEIAHWPLGVVQKAPHTDSTVNIELGKELGYDETVLELMEKLPYARDEANQNQNRIIPDSFFYNYTKERDLKRAQKHVGYDKYEAPIDSWILPIAGPSNRDGWSVVLDTRLGVSPLGDGKCRGELIEYRGHSSLQSDERAA